LAEHFEIRVAVEEAAADAGVDGGAALATGGEDVFGDGRVGEGG
jgi:hypothetical protein